jgi:hypothetical protein
LSTAQRPSGKISGQVISEDGRALARANVTIVSAGADLTKIVSERRAVATDAAGRFEADGLVPAPYYVVATAPGYQPVEPLNPVVPEFHYVGETITLRMRKGGVITGRVTNAAGEPVVGVSVSALPAEAKVPAAFGFSINLGAGELGGRETDDRGIFRLYGLAPGKYLVVAGANGFDASPTPFAGRVPTFHPSAPTRETATPVTVSSSQEVSGIDIRYRGERGHSISGKLSGGGQASGIVPMKELTLVLLKRVNAPEVIAMTPVLPVGGMTSYAFYGVLDGEYEVFAAQTQLAEEGQAASAPRRVTVRGADLSGIDLALAPLASISGKIVLEKLPVAAEGTAAPKCEAGRGAQLDELVLWARKDEPADKTALDFAALGLVAPNIPNPQGAFTLHGLMAGRHRLLAQLPDESWYLKALAFAPTKPGVPAPVPNGLLLKAGEKLTGLTLIVAAGAAKLTGAVKPTAGAKLPARLQVHLLPAEAEDKDNVLRFAETVAAGDGTFSFEHLAPGKYLLLARAVPDRELPDKPARPAAWDAAERAKLRKEAEGANAPVELKTCQRVTDFVLAWK